MFFDLNGKTYSVRFSRLNTTTLASLSVVKENGTLVETGIQGTATLYHTDRFEKSKGRKVALADLLWQVERPDDEGVIPEGLSKEDKTKIWDEYFKNHRK